MEKTMYEFYSVTEDSACAPVSIDPPLFTPQFTEALKFISDIIPPHDDPFYSLHPFNQVGRDLCASLSIALQRGNAQAVLLGMAHSHSQRSLSLTTSRQSSQPFRAKRPRTH